MTVAREREPKAERLEVRLTPGTKSLLSQAAQLQHKTLTEFLVSSAVKAAEDALLSPRIFAIHSDDGWDTLMNLVEPSAAEPPNPDLVNLFKAKR